jgi:hypothetical protein
MRGHQRGALKKGLRRELPAVIVASIAVLVALSSTGFAANVVPLAKRALKADKAKVATTAQNALKLNGATAEQIAALPSPATDAQTLNGQSAAQIAALPGPVSGIAANLISVHTESYEVVAEDQTVRVTADCGPGQKVVGGGWTMDQGHVEVLQKGPNSTNTGWRFGGWAESGNQLAAVGTVYAICLQTS